MLYSTYCTYVYSRETETLKGEVLCTSFVVLPELDALQDICENCVPHNMAEEAYRSTYIYMDMGADQLGHLAYLAANR